MTAAPTLELVNLGLAYAPRQPILHDVCLRLAPGERLAVCGFSGAGKSTLLRLIAGLTAPTSGRIFFDGRDVTDEPPAARGVAWVPQRPTLWPGLTVAQNLAMPLQLLPRRQRPAPAAIAQRVRAAAEAFELAELLDRPCDQLSGGQAQRVALARVLVRPVRLWLLDEPLASLDPPLRWQVAQRLLLHREAIAATMVCVTHDWAEASILAERIVLIADGTVSRPATADRLRADPQTLTQARLAGDPPWNLLPGVLVSRAAGSPQAGWVVRLPSAEVELPCGPATGWQAGPVWLGVRPEMVRLAPADQPPTDWGWWQLVRLQPRGGVCWSLLRRGSAELLAWAAPGTAPQLRLGQSYTLHCPADTIRLFCPKSGKTLSQEG
jgi:ABC-type sugar transport system ATPase subunit